MGAVMLSGPEFDAAAATLGIEVEHHFLPGLYAKLTRIPEGLVLTQHVHAYDHASVLRSGTVMVEVEGTGRLVTGPAALVIEAGKEHRVTALTDAVWYCIHATDDTDPATVDQSILKGG